VTKLSLYNRAIYLLAQREHSAKELKRKLLKAEFPVDEIEQNLVRLAEAGLQSDKRFSEVYTYSRSAKGFGCRRIRQELKERGVSSTYIDEALTQAKIDWFSLATSVRCKRFGEHCPDDFRDRAKQQRFLQYRGFTHEQIKESFNTDSKDYLTPHEK